VDTVREDACAGYTEHSTPSRWKSVASFGGADASPLVANNGVYRHG